MGDKDRKTVTVNWGDDTILQVKLPDLSGLEEVVCPRECCPIDGDPKMDEPKKKEETQ